MACSASSQRSPGDGSGSGAGQGAGSGGSSSAGGAGGSSNGSGSGGSQAGASGSSGSGGSISGIAGGVEDASTGGSSPEAGAASEGGSSEGGGASQGLFSDDFEEGATLNPGKWTVAMGGNASQELQTQIAAHGMYAWHVHGGSATGGNVAHGDFATILVKTPPAALKAGPVFGRAYFYATPNNNPHCQLGFAGTNPNNPTFTPTVTGNGINFNYMEFAEFGGGTWQLGFDLFTPDPAVAKGFVEEASYTHPNSPAPTKKWFCVEWEFNDNPTSMLLWVDGKQIDQFDSTHLDYHSVNVTPGSVLNGKTSGIIGGFTAFGFGFHAWGGGNPFDYYYDDIVLDTKRVGCLP
jgi:hypothetical protein